MSKKAMHSHVVFVGDSGDSHTRLFLMIMWHKLYIKAYSSLEIFHNNIKSLISSSFLQTTRVGPQLKDYKNVQPCFNLPYFYTSAWLGNTLFLPFYSFEILPLPGSKSFNFLTIPLN